MNTNIYQISKVDGLRYRRRFPFLFVGSICLRPGDLVGIKSKCCGVSDNAYRFCTGEEITFENITLTRQARGVLRGGMSTIRWIKNND